MPWFSILYFICLGLCGLHVFKWVRGDSNFEQSISMVVFISIGAFIPLLNIYLTVVYVLKPAWHKLVGGSSNG